MAKRGIKISEKTIRRSLSINFGLKSYRSTQKPRLTEAIKKKRLEFAKKHLDWAERCGKTFCFQMNPRKSNSVLGNIKFGDCLEHNIRKIYHPNSEAPFQSNNLGDHVSKR